MNSLHRKLELGNKIVMQGCPHSFEVSTLMFGALPNTTGCALGIKNETFGEIKVDATEIDAAETMARHAKENGWE